MRLNPTRELANVHPPMTGVERTHSGSLPFELLAFLRFRHILPNARIASVGISGDEEDWLAVLLIDCRILHSAS